MAINPNIHILTKGIALIRLETYKIENMLTRENKKNETNPPYSSLSQCN